MMKAKSYQRLTLTLSKDEAKVIQTIINKADMTPLEYPYISDFVQELYDTLEEFGGEV